MMTYTRPRDFQKQAVYDWEDHRFRRKSIITLSEEDCTALVTDICHCYNIPVPNMKFQDGYPNLSSSFRISSRTILLQKWGRVRYVIFHEVAHYITMTLGKDKVFHGKEWFSVYAYLISQYMSIPLYEVFHKAGKDGIQYEPYDFPKFKDNMTPDPKFVQRYT